MKTPIVTDQLCDMKTMEKKQFNIRVRANLKDATSKVAEVTDFTNEEIVEVALANLFGTSDELMIAKRNKVQRMVAQLAIELSFSAAQLPLFGRLAA